MRMPTAARLPRRVLRGRNANDVQSRLDAFAERVHGQLRRGSGAESQDHPVLDQSDGRFSRGLLELLLLIQN